MVYLITGKVTHVKSDGAGMKRVYDSPTPVVSFIVDADSTESAIEVAKQIMVTGNSFGLDSRSKWDLVAVPATSVFDSL